MEEKDGARERGLLFADTVSSIFWFLMDVGWFFESTVIVMVCAIPTMLFGALSFIFLPSTSYRQYLINGSMMAWMSMNFFWAIGDLHKISWATSLAGVSALCGVVVLGIALVLSFYDMGSWSEALKRFRRSKIFSQ